MPKVPVYDNLQTSIQTGGGPQLNGPTAGEIGATQIQRMGDALTSAGQSVSRIQLDAVTEVNQTRVNDAINRARESANQLTYDPQGGFLALKGEAALNRPDGMPLADEYGGKIRTVLRDLSGGLGNDAQRRMFQQHAASIEGSLRADAERHFLGEWTTYSIGTQDGTIKLAVDDAEQRWNEPDKVNASLQAAKAAIYQKGRLSGWAATQTDAALLATTSGVHERVITAALANGNPAYATAYLARNKAEMTADDILKVQGQVNHHTWAEQAGQAVQAATMSLRPSIVPTTLDRLVQITAQTESGGRDFAADGSILTSPKGAKGRMQVLDSTMASPGLPGVQAIDPKTATPEQRARFGADYLAALVRRYDGDMAKTWAAYNAGFGAVDKAMQAAAKGRSGSVDWLSYMPAETQDYVRKNIAAMESGSRAQVRRPTEIDFVNSALQQLPANAPASLVKMTREAAMQQFGLLDKSRTDAEAQAVAQAMQLLPQFGNRFTSLPAAVRAAIPPEKIDDVLNYAAKLYKGDDTTNPAVYQRLSNPQVLRSLSEDQFFAMRAELSEGDFKHFAGQRAALSNPSAAGGGGDPGSALSSAIHRAIDENLQVLRIDPTPKDGGEDAARVGAIRKFVTDEVLRAQVLAGKKFDEDEVRKKVTVLFAQQGLAGHWFSGNTAAQMLTMRVDDIPSSAAERLRADFARQGIPSPTSGQMLGAYWTALSRAPAADQLVNVSVPASDRAQIVEAMRVHYAKSQDPIFAPTEENVRYWYTRKVMSTSAPAKNPAAQAAPATPNASPADAAGAPASAGPRKVAEGRQTLTLKAEWAGAVVDAARIKLDEANSALLNFGSRQRAENPDGYAQAKRRVEEAQANVQWATQRYVDSLPKEFNQPALARAQNRKPLGPGNSGGLPADAGEAVDEARRRVGYAAARIRSFGSVQRQTDPKAYQDAINEMAAARQALNDAAVRYDKSLGADVHMPSFRPAQP